MIEVVEHGENLYFTEAIMAMQKEKGSVSIDAQNIMPVIKR